MSELLESWVYGAAVLFALALIVFPPVHPVGGVVGGVGLIIGSIVWPIFVTSITKLIPFPDLNINVHEEKAQVSETPDVDPRDDTEPTVEELKQQYVDGELTNAEFERAVGDRLEEETDEIIDDETLTQRDRARQPVFGNDKR